MIHARSNLAAKSPAWWRPVSVRRLATADGIRSSTFWATSLIWSLVCVACVAGGILAVIMDWQGIRLLGADSRLYVTIYPPWIVCVLVLMWLGFEWAVIPAYLTTLVLSLHSGLPFGWSIAYAFSDPLGLLVYAISFWSLPRNFQIRSVGGVFIFGVVSLMAGIAASTGSFVGSLLYGQTRAEAFASWEGWWLGAFLQAMLVILPTYVLFDAPIERLKDRYFDREVYFEASLSFLGRLVALGILAILGFVSATAFISLGRLTNLLEPHHLPEIHESLMANRESMAIVTTGGLLVAFFGAYAALRTAHSWSSLLTYRESEERFRQLFDDAPVSIWEADFSAVGQLLASLRSQGVEDLRTFLESEAGALQHALGLVRLVDVNNTTVRMFEAKNKEELFAVWPTLFTSDTFDVFARELQAIWEGQHRVDSEGSAVTVGGRLIYYQLHWIVPIEDGRMNLRRVIVALADITERKRAELALQHSSAQVQALSRRLLEAQEQERRRIASDIHDSVIQSLATAQNCVESLREQMAHAVQLKALDELHRTIARSVDDLRSLSFELGTPVLYELGLIPAILDLAETFQDRTGITVTVTHDDSELHISEFIRITIFRAVRELLTNVGKHADAKSVRIEIQCTRDRMAVRVEDDGVGIAPALIEREKRTPSGFGLPSSRAQINYVGGNMEIRSNPGHGTQIAIDVPLTAAAD